MKFILKFIFLLLVLAIFSGFAFTDAFADVTITPVAGSAAPGCESSACYSPSVAYVDVGDQITFSNTDSAAHTFTAGNGDTGPTGEFDTGIETHDEYTNLNRPFNLLEPIPMKIDQKVSQYMEGYFESTISDEKTVNLKELGLMDVTRVLMMAKTDLGGGDTVIRVYDKETGVLITNVEKYHLDGKEFTSGMVLVDTNIFSAPTKLPSKTQSSATTTNSNLLKETTTKKSNSITSGTYLENIIIKNKNYDYTITAKLGPKSSDTSYVRVIAENECPFKKQIFQKDFQNRLGTEVTFSFYQLSQSKPQECSIHFTLSTFEGKGLETIVADYYLEQSEIKQQTTNKLNNSPQLTNELSSNTPQIKKNIPIWVKNIFGWYAADQVSEVELLNAIKYLIDEKILIVN